MSQDDIYIMLKAKRLSCDDKYYSAKEIQKILNGKGISITINSINTSLLKLRCFGFLDMRIDVKKEKRITYPYTVYRLKREYIE